MAIDKRLKIYDDQGHDVDYDIMADDVKFMPDGKDLPTKLAEMEEEIGEGGYTPPADGIPKTDLAPSVQTSLDKADTALQAADKAQLQAAITSLQGALNALIGGNVQGAIDTFNEVVAFLNGIDTSDPTLKNQLLALNNAITALQTALAGKISGIKANGASTTLPVVDGIVELPPAGSTISPATAAPSMDGTAAVGVSAKYAREDHVHPKDTSKQDVLTFDNAPTAGSNNPVKSGGIKTALDGKANVADVPTNQDMADAIDDALGEAQVTVVPASSVGIISSLGSDSDEDALSASMGKKLKVAIITILSNLGEYAFPNGKPTIDWGGSSSVTYTVTYPTDSKITHSGAGDTVELGSSLEVTLGIASGNDLYVIKDSSVKVYMGGVEQSGAYSASTQKVTLAAVTGAVVIVAESMTYVGYGQQSSPLALMLDCKNRGGQSGHWIDLIGSKDFALTDVTEADSGMVFNGSSSKGVASGNVPVLASAGTIESVFTIADSATDQNMIFMNPYTQGIALAERFDGNQTYIFNFIANDGNGQSINGAYMNGGHNLVNAVSVSNARGINNEVAQTAYPEHTWLGFDTTTVLAVGYRKRSSGENFFKGTIKSIRIYSRALSEAEVLQNYEVDKKRFNLA